ncbi:MAG: hypothetical protein ACTSUZ_15115 [Candidatus Thorarchaeota archaeon]
MIKLEGITPEESVYHSIRCTYENLWGDLTITNKGVVFLEIKGMLGQGRERRHQFDFDEIVLIKIKKKNSGIFKQCIAISYHSNQSEDQTYCFSCEKYKAVLFLAIYERHKLSLKTPEESSSAIQSLSKFKRHGDLLNVAKNPKMKPFVTAFFLGKIEAAILSQLRTTSDVDLFEVSSNKQVHSLIARLHESDPKQLSKDQAYYTVIDIVAHLISRRELDGIITEVGSYVSNRNLARRKVPYDMLADFETIFAQLYENGFLIYKIECPTCFRKIKYPKRGKKITCQFCKNPILALDVFKKVKDLL